MPQKTLLITDFFAKCRSTTVSNAALFEKPVKVIKVDEHSIIKHDSLESEEILSAKTDEVTKTSPSKSSIPSRIKFVRHHSAPLHHRSPVKMRERLMEHQDLEEIRARIRAFRNDLYKYKSTYSRSPIKRPNNTTGDSTPSPFKLPAPQTPLKRYND